MKDVKQFWSKYGFWTVWVFQVLLIWTNFWWGIVTVILALTPMAKTPFTLGIRIILMVIGLYFIQLGYQNGEHLLAWLN